MSEHALATERGWEDYGYGSRGLDDAGLWMLFCDLFANLNHTVSTRFTHEDGERFWKALHRGARRNWQMQ